MSSMNNRRQNHHHHRHQRRHDDDPWLHRSFLKDAKMRVRERYWRELFPTGTGTADGDDNNRDNNNFLSSSLLSSSSPRYVIIPDALAWRKYLRWIETVVLHDDKSTSSCTDNSSTSSNNSNVVWCLLESVVENMDYRNQSPVVAVAPTNHEHDDDDSPNRKKIRESAVPQERSTILRLFREQQQQQQQQSSSSSSSSSSRLEAFCDLSYRVVVSSSEDQTCDHDDEWQLMQYEKITTEERSRHAIVRAAQMIQDCSCFSSSSSQSTDSAPPPRTIIVVVEDDDNHYDNGLETSLLTAVGHQDDGLPTIRCMKMKDVLDLWNKEGMVDDTQYERLSSLLQSSHEDYVRRNTPKILAPANADAKDDDATLVPEQEVEYWSDDMIEQGLAKNELVKGRLEVTKENPREAFVVVSSAQQQQQQQHDSEGVKHYFVDANRGHFNRALHHDTVILKPLPKSAWGYPVGKRRLVVPTASDPQDDDTIQKDQDDDILSSSSSLFPSFPSARVVAIANPTARRRNIVATLVDVPMDGESSAALLVVPMNVLCPKIRLIGRGTTAWHKYVGMRLRVDLIHPAQGGWPVTSRYPQGYCREILGPVGDIETEIVCLLHENQIDLNPFSLAAKACLPALGNDGGEGEVGSWTIPQQEISSRRDLREYCIFSVDPPGCQDIDDTMHARRLPSGLIEVGVHIADVTHFVRQGSALDREAQVRGTTFYLVDRRFDMLPSVLSSNLCSLHGGTDRLAVSVIWTLSPDLREIISTWFGRTIIHNVAAMTYDQADNILQGKPPEEPGSKKPPPLTAGSPVDRKLIPALREHLELLTQVARLRRRQREELGGAVDLSSSGGGDGNKDDDNAGSSELKFQLVNGSPVAVKPKQDKEIHHTIAELMIWANTSVATKIYDCFPNSALLRVHQAVEEDRFEGLQQMLKAANISTDGDGAAGVRSNRALAQTLQSAQKATTSVVQALFRSLATRAMSEALYVSSGEQRKRMLGQQQEQSDFAHYGLGLEIYTHFTSPIRRYADVIVHVQLLAALEQEKMKAMLGCVTSQTLVVEDQRKPLESLPASEVVSVLAGDVLRGEDERTTDDDEDDFIDALIDGAADEILDQSTPETTLVPAVDDNRSTACHQSFEPYDGTRVGTICQHLNLHNRLAKHSSMDCQNLFLSLYFRYNVEIVQGVVTTIRENGFFCYVPKFDMRAPVFLKDMDGAIQMDPSFFGLSCTTGEEPTRGFANTAARLFRNGRIAYVPEDHLTVSVTGSPTTFTVKPLDVVSVQISCTEWDHRARVPLPRLQLVVPDEQQQQQQQQQHQQQQHKKGNDSVQPMNSQRVKGEAKSNEATGDLPIEENSATSATVYDVVRRQSIKPTVEPFKRSTNLPERKHGFTGRFVYGDFVNPDTRSAQQEAAQEAAAAESAARRAALSVEAAARGGGPEYATAQRIEREVTARQQRLHAVKRNARRAKAK